MSAPAPDTKISLRRMTEADVISLAAVLNGADIKTSIPRSAYAELSLQAPPADFPVLFRADRQWVVEKGGLLLGHFLLVSVNDHDQCGQCISAFSNSASEHDIHQAFDTFLDILFQQKHLHKISFLVYPSYLFFFTVAQHLALFLEGTLHSQLRVKDEWYDVAVFSQVVEGRVLFLQQSMQKIAALEGSHDWLIRQALHDNIHIAVVRAIIVQIAKPHISVLLLKTSAQSQLAGLEEAPGGRVAEGEGLFQALERTVREQTGLKISKEIHYLTCFDFTTDDNKRIREFVFRVKPTAWEVTINPKDHESYAWVALQDLPSSRLHPDLIHLLSSYSPTLAYETEEIPVHEHEAAIELVRPTTAQLEEALLVGHHLDAYAAKGLPMIEPLGLILRDSANRIVGGLSVDIAYGCLYLRRLWVDPNWRRVGWGRKLVIRAESIAREKGCTFAITHVMDWEETPFFQKLGYVVESLSSGYQNSSRQFRFRKELLQ